MAPRLITFLLLVPPMAALAAWGSVTREKALMLVLGLPLLLWSLVQIFVFAVADADLTILSKSAPPADAFKDKVVWITGASQGIGEHLAQEFERLGAKLILSSRRTVELERVKGGLSGKSSVLLLPLDMSAGEAVISEAVEEAESAFNGHGVDIMVHNAAYPRPKLGFLDISEKDTQASFAVNVLGTITLTRFLARKMIDRGHGHFVVLSSAAGKIPAPGQSVYAATKHAVHGYFGALRNEVGSAGIKVTLVCPGPIAANATQKERQPMGRFGDLIMRAVYHELEETWISIHPVLVAIYLHQYCPSLASFVMQKLGPRRVKKGNPYTLREMLAKDE